MYHHMAENLKPFCGANDATHFASRTLVDCKGCIEAMENESTERNLRPVWPPQEQALQMDAPQRDVLGVPPDQTEEVMAPEGPATYPSDVVVIRVKRGQKVAVQWEYDGRDGHIGHIREARFCENDADVLSALDVLKLRLS